MPRITFVNEHRVIEAPEGASVYDVARANGIALDVHRFRGAVSCGGRGLCRACVCWVDESAPGAAGPRSFVERLRGLRGWRRLACRTKLAADVKVFTTPAAGNRVGVARPIDPAPSPVTDAAAPRKRDDAASTAAHVHGHPAAIGSGRAGGTDTKEEA